MSARTKGTNLLLAVALLVGICGSAHAQSRNRWSPTRQDGEKLSLYVAPGDSVIGAHGVFDTLHVSKAYLTTLSVDYLNVSQSDSSTVAGLDTTVTGAGSSARLAPFYDDRDPNCLGRYTETGTLTTDLPAAITDELAGSIWRDEGIAWPINGIIQVSVRGDSVTIRRGDNAAVVLRFLPIAGGILTTTTPGITDVAYMDRTLWLTGVDSVGVTAISLRTGVVKKVLESGVWQWNGALSERNSNKGWTRVSASPALLDSRVNSIGVMRSPWSSPKDALITLGTFKGAAQFIYAADGTLSIYDEVTISPVRDVEVLPDGQIVGIVTSSIDSVFSYNSALAVTSDSKAPDAIYAHGRTGSLSMPWDSTSSFNAVSALPGKSSAGRDGARVFVGADSGLVVLDQKPSDQAGGMRQVIRKSYVEPMAAFSSAGSPTLSGPVAVLGVRDSLLLTGTFSSAPTSEAPPTWVATNDGPLSHAMTFNGATQYLNAETLLDSLSDDTQGTWSLWLKSADGYTSSFKPFLTISDPDTTTVYIQMFVVQNSGAIRVDWRPVTAEQWRITTSSAMLVDGANPWVHVAIVQDGVSPVLYVNGTAPAQVLNAYVDRTQWMAGFTAAENVIVGGRRLKDGLTMFHGSITGVQFYSRALSSTEIAALYKAGAPFIETPTPDTLTVSNRIQFTDADWLSGRVLLGDSSRVELRHSSGALLDTFLCTGCGQLYSAQFKRTPSADSLNIVIAGATGIRVIGQNPKLTDYASSEWPRREYYIGNREAIVDSAGYGHFWKLQDAIDAIAAVGAKVITVAAGTYPDPVTNVGKSVMIEGEGRRTVITNANSTTDEAMTVTGDSVIVRDLCLYTAPGGAGGGVDALLWSGARGIAENVRVVDADDDAAVITGRFFQASNLRIDDADDRGLSVEAGRALLTSPVFSSGGTSVVFAAAGDTSRVIGGDIAGNIHAASGAVKIAIIGTNYGTLSDVGSGVTEGSSNP